MIFLLVRQTKEPKVQLNVKNIYDINDDEFWWKNKTKIPCFLTLHS